jgi:AMMECR1 domain-containing protein
VVGWRRCRVRSGRNDNVAANHGLKPKEVSRQTSKRKLRDSASREKFRRMYRFREKIFSETKPDVEPAKIGTL